MSDAGPTLWLRRRKGGGGIWYVRVGTGLRSTGRPEADRAGAEDDLARHAAGLVRNPPAGSSVAGVPVALVLDHWVARSDEATATGDDPVAVKLRRATPRAKAKVLGTLLGELDVGELGPSAGAAYRDLRMGACGSARSRAQARLRLGPGGSWEAVVRERVAHNTVVSELSALRAAVRGYAKLHGLHGVPEIPVPRRLGRAHVKLTRDHLARLLWAARGRLWDAEAGRWAPPGPGVRGGASHSSAHLARMILVAAYTASACWCVIRLRWAGAPGGEASYVDLEASPPLLYRLGRDAAAGKQAGKPVVLNRRIATHLRRWRDADAARGFETVVRYKGAPLKYVPQTTFKKLVAAAGLPDSVQMDDLARSAGRHVAAREGVSIWNGALFMGLTTEAFGKRYATVRPDHQREATTALSRKRRLPGL